MEEHAALSVLHRWGEMNEFVSGAIPLVPEHVEIRSLHIGSNPGLPQVTGDAASATLTAQISPSLLPQGYLHMWVDMFPTDVPPPPTVDIKPRLPVQSVSPHQSRRAPSNGGAASVVIFSVFCSGEGMSCGWSSGTPTTCSWKTSIPSLEIPPRTSTSKGPTTPTATPALIGWMDGWIIS